MDKLRTKPGPSFQLYKGPCVCHTLMLPILQNCLTRPKQLSPVSPPALLVPSASTHAKVNFLQTNMPSLGCLWEHQTNKLACLPLIRIPLYSQGSLLSGAPRLINARVGHQGLPEAPQHSRQQKMRDSKYRVPERRQAEYRGVLPGTTGATYLSGASVTKKKV